MDIVIRKMEADDWSSVIEIYIQGVQSNKATFNTACPSWPEWDAGHIQSCRYVAEENGDIVGWAALAPINARECFKGVAEDSIYVAENCCGRHIGEKLLTALLADSEKEGFWTVQAQIFQTNSASIALHKKCGFREIGYRERIAKDRAGNWQNTVLMEHRITSDLNVGCDCESARAYEREREAHENEIRRELGFLPEIKKREE